MIRWFNSICESVTSKPLFIGVYGSSKKLEVCNKIEDTLLALYARIETFFVYLYMPGVKDKQKLYPRLYKAGIVLEEEEWPEAVSHYSLTFYFTALLAHRMHA